MQSITTWKVPTDERDTIKDDMEFESEANIDEG